MDKEFVFEFSINGNITIIADTQKEAEEKLQDMPNELILSICDSFSFKYKFYEEHLNDDFIFYKGESNPIDIQNTMKRLREVHDKNVKDIKDEGQLLD